MKRGKLVVLVALAFVVGLVAAAIALSEGGTLLAGGNADALLVQVANEGHEATIRVQIYPVGEGAGSGRWEWIIASGGSQVARYPEPPGQMVVQVFAHWEDSLSPHDGEVRFTPNPDDCPGKTARLLVNVDTTRGVSIRREPGLLCE